MRYILLRSILLFLFPALAWAQIPVSQPTTLSWYGDVLEIELRLKGSPKAGIDVTKVSDFPTKRLETIVFDDYNVRHYTYTVPCWNKSSDCPAIIAVTYRVYAKLPWGSRINVTKYTNCAATECLLAGVFGPISAKPGEGYSFKFDRVQAVWDSAPVAVSLPK